jgi:hypothetical protein
MDLEGLVLSTTALTVAAAHEPAADVASIHDGRPFLLADGRGVRLAAIAPPRDVPHDEQLPATDDAQAAVAVTCRICLRTAGRDRRNGGFALWDDPYHVVKQASWVDVLAAQGRFAPVRGKVSW